MAIFMPCKCQRSDETMKKKRGAAMENIIIFPDEDTLTPEELEVRDDAAAKE